VQATERARTYLQQHRRFTFSEITRYEVLRGLLSKGAVRQQQAFEQLCLSSTVLPLTADIVRQAAVIYADLYTRGELIGDADILIAATAMTHGLAVATNNEAHFRRIPGLVLENWLRLNLES
jgi:tRNA(fMet)-specific endonuclease VapC